MILLVRLTKSGNNFFRLHAKNLIYFGLRDVDEKEDEIIKKLGIKAFYMSDIKKFGITNIISDIISQTSKQYYHLSFDIDGLDPIEAPSTGTKVECGLSCKYLHVN